jgi:hypothetical protein
MNLRKVTGEGLYLASLKERPESATVHCNRDELAFFELPVSVKRAWNKKAADINGTPSGRDSAAVTALKETAQFHKPAAPEGETPETPETDAKDLEIASRHKCDSQDDLTECYNEMTVHACSLERRLRAGGRDEGELRAAIDTITSRGCENFANGNCSTHGLLSGACDPCLLASAVARPVAPAIPEKVREALEFYGDPETYHACTFLFDAPTGGFDADFEEAHGHPDYDRPMPGKLAREALALLAPSTTTGEGT